MLHWGTIRASRLTKKEAKYFNLLTSSKFWFLISRTVQNARQNRFFTTSFSAIQQVIRYFWRYPRIFIGISYCEHCSFVSKWIIHSMEKEKVSYQSIAMKTPDLQTRNFKDLLIHINSVKILDTLVVPVCRDIFNSVSFLFTFSKLKFEFWKWFV